MVEHVKRLEAKEQVGSFRDGELFLRRGIHVDFIRPAQYIPLRIAPVVGCRHGKGRRVEPLAHRLGRRVLGYARHHIRAAGGRASIGCGATSGHGEWQTRLPDKNSVYLPSSQQKTIHEGVAVDKGFPRAEWQLVGSIDIHPIMDVAV